MTTSAVSYAQDPWYNQNSTAPSYSASYQAWNVPTSTPLHDNVRQTHTRIKEEQQQQYDGYNQSYSLTGYTTNSSNSLRGSDSYQGSSSQSYVMSPQSTAPSRCSHHPIQLHIFLSRPRNQNLQETQTNMKSEIL